MITYPAFGPKIEPTMRGEFSKLGLDTLLIDDMPDTLISVSQICKGGNTNTEHAAIFTSEGVRVFEFDSIREALTLIHRNGVEILLGLQVDGIYITQPNEFNKSNTLFMAQFDLKSMYDHIHHVTGHPRERVMKWHKQNSINADYSDSDENKYRGICKGCVFGNCSQTATDHHRQWSG